MASAEAHMRALRPPACARVGVRTAESATVAATRSSILERRVGTSSGEAAALRSRSRCNPSAPPMRPFAATTLTPSLRVRSHRNGRRSCRCGCAVSSAAHAVRRRAAEALTAAEALQTGCSVGYRQRIAQALISSPAGPQRQRARASEANLAEARALFGMMLAERTADSCASARPPARHE